MTVVTDKFGRSLSMRSVLTIVPVQHAAEARRIAAEFLRQPELVDFMLESNLRPIGASVVTHVGCYRHAWNDEVTQQSRFMISRIESWVDGILRTPVEGVSDRFAMYVGSENATLIDDLGMEVV